MKKDFKYLLYVFIVSQFIIISCDKKEANKIINDSITQGNVHVLVDESILPIIQDEVQVFENSYEAKITLEPLSEAEVILSLTKKKGNIILLSRKLNAEENSFFLNKKIIPKVTKFARDAIVFIENKKSSDSIINVNDVVNFLKGKQNRIKGLVFDNPNSSTVRYFKELAKLDVLPEKGIYSFKTNNEVIRYVEKNDGMIGVVGLNWLTQPDKKMQSIVDNIKILSVENSENDYIFPSQDNIASGKYPLARDLYIINCQGYQGLGIGLASFIAGDVGQRIVLKSGLVPITMPGRNILVRNKLEKK